MTVFENIVNVFYALTLYAVPLAVLGMFIFSLIRFIRGKMQQRRDPQSITPADMRGRLIMLIVFAAILGVMLIVILALCLVMLSAIAYM